MTPATAARKIRIRVDALPANLRRAALAWLRPEDELAEELGRAAPANSGFPLRRVPYLLKDLFDFAGVPTRAGSTFLERARPVPATDSAIVTALRQAGAACAGKTHLVEFAAGLFGDNSHYGDCPHPVFPDRVAGGSSSGSAALVAAGVVPCAIGTDTGGSVRVPASFCGLFGFRLAPREALIRDAFPLSPTLDTAGWFTAHAADMLSIWRVLASGKSGGREPRGCFLPAESLPVALEPAVAAAYARIAASFAPPAGDESVRDLLPTWAGSIDTYSTIALHEAHAIHRDWLEPFRPEYEPGIWQRFRDGGNFSAETLHAAEEALARVRSGWGRFFADHDFLVLPATPFPALRRSECTLEARRRMLALTAPASLGGRPVLTVPVALPSGLTTGLQFVVAGPDSPAVEWILRHR